MDSNHLIPSTSGGPTRPCRRRGYVSALTSVDGAYFEAFPLAHWLPRWPSAATPTKSCCVGKSHALSHDPIPKTKHYFAQVSTKSSGFARDFPQNTDSSHHQSHEGVAALGPLAPLLAPAGPRWSCCC